MGPSSRQISLILLGAVCALGIGCRKDKHDSLSLAGLASEGSPELTMEKMKTQSFGANGQEWELVTPTAQGFSEQKKMHAEDLKITFYQAGRKSTDLTADEGVFRFKDERVSTTSVSIKLKAGAVGLGPGDFYLSGHVVAVSTDASKLFTDWLRYDRTSGLITSTAPVRVVRDDSITVGVGMEATADMSSAKIFNQTVTIKEKALKKKK